MKILIIEPYFTGSHAAWAEGYKKYSSHEVQILSLSGQFWKWRMHGGAVTLARRFLQSDFSPDFILATDMLDLTTFLALTREKTHSIPCGIYFHENQICYPWAPKDRDVQKNRDRHYGFINYASALAANVIFFNSHFHQNEFFSELPRMLKQFPDYHQLDTVKNLQDKSQVLQLGLDLRRFDEFQTNQKIDKPLILWNHRWEYDKNPDDFFAVLEAAKNSDLEFKLAVLGENFSTKPNIFDRAKQIFKEEIVQFGFAETFAEYAKWLWKADIIPVTSNQDFFGASVAEAVYCNCYPLLPRRLAFPEIVPIENHPDNFYVDNSDLLAKLAALIENIDKVRQVSLRSCVEKFDWSFMAQKYDQAFEQAVR